MIKKQLHMIMVMVMNPPISVIATVALSTRYIIQPKNECRSAVPKHLIDVVRISFYFHLINFLFMSLLSYVSVELVVTNLVIYLSPRPTTSWPKSFILTRILRPEIR